MMCMKLVKWIVVPTIIVAAGGYVLFGRGLASYASTAYDDVRKAVQGNVPVDFELRRARGLIQKIDPEIKEAQREVARAEVELEHLDGQIEDLKTALARAETKMKRHRAYISSDGEAVPVFASNPAHGLAAVRNELCRTFDVYRNQAELMKSKTALRERQVRVLESARSKLLSVRGERDKLVDVIEALDARKRQLDALAATSQHSELDTSSLREAKLLLADIQKRLDVSQKIIQEELFLATGSVDPKADEARDIAREFDEFFGAPKTNGGLTREAPVGASR